MQLRWEDYPTISYYKDEDFDIITLESPRIVDVLKEVEDLGEDQAIILKDAEFLPEDSRRYMKKRVELKIPVEEVSPWSHFTKHFKRITKNSPKRGYKWQNKRNNTSVFVPFSSLFDGLKFFMSCKETDVNVYSSGPDKIITGKVGSRSGKRKYRVFQTAVLKDDFTSWRFYNCSCGCEAHKFGKYTATKYVNPENYVCLHHVGYYNLAMKDEDNDICPLFPGPTSDYIKFDENLTRVFAKRYWNQRLSFAHRNLFDSVYLGLLNERGDKGLSFWRNDAILAYQPLAQD